ncbi:bifunctional 3-deoxy-7-phosphoheptulonate synthase/chorismate mutase type II [Hymenobacter sp. 15J16-1T3B]|uniref:chorismate mutase n=1 Tax=Hymenobacter sp. 15J16-1T3B TaxID=2886941 RepID=UPI001D11E4D5|nr:chorismate mutase [Hymenobacter sp. 15J16-1T3B]MCC3156242.1 bifunctional 3-deoxy-7-phosphoheptulonate synthase/chorismate mutase type II [Hymenobacter sp. 15J16-1T3B]
MNPTPASAPTKTNPLLADKPLVIAGPCSAETEAQVLDTCQRLAQTGRVNMLRAGIWKPRTKPGLFEGIGTKGLPWLVRARELTGLPVAVEVATAKHVEDCLAFGVDVLWLGARTTVNPFSVQEVAAALRGVEVPVLIKNPLNPDVELWSGAVERLRKVGVEHLGLIHRGFSSYGQTEFRNAPMWHLPIEMKRRFPELPILSDPSHIAGRRELLPGLAQQAADLDFDGLMIEAHQEPDAAWSDAAQQVTPEALAALLDALIWRRETTDRQEFLTALAQLRERINHLDDEILQLLSKRMQVAEQIGRYKKDNNITILQPGRWQEIVDRGVQKGAKLGLSAGFIHRLLDAIHLESITHQDRVMNE